MNEHGFLSIAVILLLAAVVFVPISKKLGLGPVLGYLLAGVMVGPWALKIVTNVEDIMRFSEFGVVLFLFLIGLELEPKKLWALRLPIFGMGGAQILMATLALGLFAKMLGFTWSVAWLCGMGFSLSSTAIGLQALQERGMMNTTSGKTAFSILLFQDMAVIPMMAILPLLVSQAPAHGEGSAWLVFLKVIGILLLVIFLGRVLLRPVLKIIANTHLREIFTAFALLLVLGMALLMSSFQISMGLGAFMAGVLLADSEYRHALETDIEPFKGLLLGLFFISVGMSIDFQSIVDQPALVALMLVGILIVKIIIHWLLATLFSLPRGQRMFFAVIISQVGEFSFVLFGLAHYTGVLSQQETGVLTAIVALSMLSTPFLAWIYEKFLNRYFQKSPLIPEDKIENEHHPVIIAGFGRFGQIVGRLLYANGISATVLDHEPDQIELLRRFGFKIYYGDATRLDLLESAGIETARILVVAIDDVDDNLRLVDLAQLHFPHLKIVARARNVQHYFSLLDRKVDIIERELFESSLKVGVEVLRLMGWPAYQAVTAANKFRVHNLDMVLELHPERSNEKEMISKAKQARADLEKMFEEERIMRETTEGGWD
jgi:glutathione-regulated potassium-efflux system ancillary protein KefC